MRYWPAPHISENESKRANGVNAKIVHAVSGLHTPALSKGTTNTTPELENGPFFQPKKFLQTSSRKTM
jgi:hypothetical protein